MAALLQSASGTDYRIGVRLDPETHRLQGRQVVRYTNTSPDAIPDLQFHLYLNAFKNEQSTFMRESSGQLRLDTMPEDGWGWIDVRSLKISGAELVHALEFIQPDGTDPEDQTVVRLPLPIPLPPGQALELEIHFEAQLPKLFARTGYAGDYVLAGQWFPKLGVWESAGQRGRQAPGWNCHQFHANSEFYADFGTYDVEITVPAGYVVGATGQQTDYQETETTATYTFHQARVIDFAWTASPRFVKDERVFKLAEWVSSAQLQKFATGLGLTPEAIALPEVTMILLLQPEHADEADRYAQALGTAIKHFGLWYGPYPYRTITLVDPPANGRGSAGMEYPTFITADSRRYMPEDDLSLDYTIIHEFGHQYWQSMVASNEFEDPWLDEGFTSYSAGRILDRVYGPARPYLRANQVPLPVPGWFGFADVTQAQLARVGPILDRGQDRITRRAWDFRSPVSYGLNTYLKTAAVLRQLELELGEDVMARVMRTYFTRWRFRHPSAGDFMAVAQEVSGQDLRWFFRPLIYGTGTVDYAVAEVTSERLGFEAGVYDHAGGQITITPEQVATRRKEAAQAAHDRGPYRHTVVVANRGEMGYPVEVLVRFADGEEVRERWDGAYPWVRYTYQRQATLDRVVVDPDGRLLLDVNRANNSYVEEPALHADRRWAAHLFVLAQRALCVLGALTI